MEERVGYIAGKTRLEILWWTAATMQKHAGTKDCIRGRREEHFWADNTNKAV